MRKKFTIQFILFVLTIFLCTGQVYAVSFSDVNRENNSAWAYDYIMELADKKIINGYEDGTFKPESAVSYLELIKLLDGLTKPNSIETSNNVYKFSDILEELSIPNWAKPAVANALARNITTETELRNAKKYGMTEPSTNKRVDRLTVFVYLARALNLEGKTAVVLEYKDADKIDQNFIYKIGALIDAGILDRAGRDGYFEGDSPIKRSEMAKVIKLSYDWKKGAEKEDYIEGTLNLVEIKNYKIVAIIRKTDGKNIEAIFDENTKIRKNSESLNFSEIQSNIGKEIKAKCKNTNGDYILKELEIKDLGGYSEYEEFSYKGYKISNGKYIINVEQGGRIYGFGCNYSYAYDKDKNRVSFENIKDGSKLKLKFYDTDNIERIDISADGDSEGDYIFIGTIEIDGHTEIMLKDKNSGDYISYKTKTLYANYESGQISVEDIPGNEKVSVKFIDDEITEINIGR